MPISGERKETFFGNSLREGKKKTIKAAALNCSGLWNARSNPAEMD